MTPLEDETTPQRGDQQEARLAARAAQGDRAAFDLLFDRYFNRVAWRLRDLPEREAQAATWETLEQIFSGLEATGSPLATRAYRIACASHAVAARRSASQKRNP